MNELLNQWWDSQLPLMINNTMDQDFISNEKFISYPGKVHAAQAKFGRNVNSQKKNREVQDSLFHKHLWEEYIQGGKFFNVRLDLYFKSKCTCKVKCKCEAIIKKEFRSVVLNITHMPVIFHNAECAYSAG